MPIGERKRIYAVHGGKHIRATLVILLIVGGFSILSAQSVSFCNPFRLPADAVEEAYSSSSRPVNRPWRGVRAATGYQRRSPFRRQCGRDSGSPGPRSRGVRRKPAHFERLLARAQNIRRAFCSSVDRCRSRGEAARHLSGFSGSSRGMPKRRPCWQRAWPVSRLRP